MQDRKQQIILHHCAVFVTCQQNLCSREQPNQYVIQRQTWNYMWYLFTTVKDVRKKWTKYYIQKIS